VTIDAAWQVFQEGNRGSLEPGKYADLVVLSGNPLEDPMAMRDLQVERTVVGAPLFIASTDSYSWTFFVIAWTPAGHSYINTQTA